MSNHYRYRTFEEFADAFETVRKQARAMKWLFGFMVIVIVAGFAALFYSTQDIPRHASVLDSRVRSLERQDDQEQSSIKQVGAELQKKLTALGEEIEKVERDVATLRVRLGGTGGDAAGAQDNANPSTNEQKSDDSARAPQNSATAPQASVKNDDTQPPPLPLPRPRKMTQAPAALRPAVSAGQVEVKVGNQIVPGQFDLEPIPDELENKIPRLKGMAFFRYAGQIYVVDLKDNRIVELLK